MRRRDPVSDLVWNERIKLAAAWLNAISTASMAAGVIAPVAALGYGLGTGTSVTWAFVGFSLVWLFLAAALHMVARNLLRGLRS